MQLFYSPTSPYARKVRIVLQLLELERDVELVATNPLGDATELQARNPLGKVPALVLADGRALYDSRVICEHLDREAMGGLIPADGESRDGVLVAQALADGITDAAFALVMERRRPSSEQSAHWCERWQSAILRGVAAIAVPGTTDAPTDLGDIATAVALDYLDFRLPDIEWRAAYAAAGRWQADAVRWPAMVATAPPQA